MMRSILLSIAIVGLIAFTGYAAQEAGNAAPQATRRGMRGARGARGNMGMRRGPARQGTQYVENEDGRWLVHDVNRPAPPVVTPGTASTQEKAGTAPSDAVVLFDGKDLSSWVSMNGNPANWVVKDGYFTPGNRGGDIKTKESFGSCQLHLEFASPVPAVGTSQGRGNSGVFIMSTYEVQILDSFENKTYVDGMCGALYGRRVPDVDVSRPPDQWQTYDIIYHRPIFDGDEVTRKATFTVLHNGVLIQDHVALTGGTGWIDEHTITNYEPHADKLPLQIQYHNNPVKFRNIWIREIKD